MTGSLKSKESLNWMKKSGRSLSDWKKIRDKLQGTDFSIIHSTVEKFLKSLELRSTSLITVRFIGDRYWHYDQHIKTMCS